MESSYSVKVIEQALVVHRQRDILQGLKVIPRDNLADPPKCELNILQKGVPYDPISLLHLP